VSGSLFGGRFGFLDGFLFFSVMCWGGVVVGRWLGGGEGVWGLGGGVVVVAGVWFFLCFTFVFF